MKNTGNFIKNSLFCFLVFAALHNTTIKPSTESSFPGSFVTKITSTVGAVVIGYVLLLWYTSTVFDNTKDQLVLLQEFETDKDYQKLKNKASDIYHNRRWLTSSRSLDSQYPVPWLEREISFNKNFLFYVKFVSPDRERKAKINKLVYDIDESLSKLRANKSFEEDKKESYKLHIATNPNSRPHVHLHLDKKS